VIRDVQPARRDDAEAVIAAAVKRGAISESRAQFYRDRHAAGEDITETVSTLAGSALRGDGFGGDVQASMFGPPNKQHDPILYAANPVHEEMKQRKPGLVHAAQAESGPPPKLFGDDHLPSFTASGISPAVLPSLPWALRHPVASAPTQAAAYALVNKYAGAPEMAHADHATTNPDNASYIQAYRLWLAGNGGASPDVAKPSSATLDELHGELFGNSVYDPEEKPSKPSQG
jgi:hypothetical protein